MTDPAFFGYGSLVNLRTHDYVAPKQAEITGWRRIWQQSGTRPVAFLSVHPVANTTIQGLIASVPSADWAALDEREYNYDRVDVTATLNSPTPTALYQGTPSMIAPPDSGHPILLSYLDVVVQGYLDQFGEEGVQCFFDTTDGWHTAILDDRTNPLYPRHQTLTTTETELVDLHLNRLSAQMQQAV